ncbi:glycosyltransferase [Methylobacterium oxalidis]|uniref:Glycosyl transferase n=1 Tax=Methylobacterium oxalidis TaxID=944322 RepID=A0A512J7E1_9HYPH|nr:glycosyltransferase [Methylobacterium oxalidis]GEP05799.1 glycosyl transferase [Methylobacterium oxalidis]GJE35322.1 N-acetylgalactosamine-N, N'-diacetylbacillosaminyl-diphospho-undecaprenol4-alpha-N-acetylgalactosaminyltransferase [Methylobacterium oxalidis]GLS62619.1 glycosyl transferase [Methylobacterium oxalidis]
MSRIRSVAIYVPCLQPGGAERVAAVLATGFHVAGISTTLIVDAERPENRGFVAPGVSVVVLGGGHLGNTRRLAGWLRRSGADVVMAIDAPASVKLAAAKLLARSRTPIVISYHGHAEIVRGRLGGAAFRLAFLLTRLSDRTVCVSEGLARRLVAEWRAEGAKIVSIPNPIPVEHAHRAADAADLAARPPAIVAVGRLVAEKRYDSLIRALTLLPANVRLTILGDGPERAALERAAAEAGVAARVSLPGFAEPWPAYGAARVFALSSVSESFGNVVVEALASGLPVVATDCGGPGEILEGGRYGTLVPVGDTAALAAGLGAALADPGDPALRIARAAAYAVPQIVERYLAVFESVVAGHA